MKHTMHGPDHKPLANTLTKRTHGQCPYCLHYGTNCHCHRRKTMPASRVHQTVYIVTEDEPDNVEFPSIVIGAYATKAGAEGRIAYERKARGLTDDEVYADADIGWGWEEQKVYP